MSTDLRAASVRTISGVVPSGRCASGCARPGWKVAALAALVWLAAGPASAIIIQDSPTTVFSSTASSTLSSNFTVTSGASVLVFEAGFVDSTTAAAAPATITFGTQTMTLAGDQKSTLGTGGGYREEALYYLYNPDPGTSTLTITPAASVALTTGDEFTLAGVDTSGGNPVLTAGADNKGGSSPYSDSISIGNIVQGSAAVVAVATGGNNASGMAFNATSGSVLTPNLWSSSYNVSGNFTTTAAGLVTGLAAGSTTFGATAGTLAVGSKMPILAAVFAPALAGTYSWTGATNSNWSLASGDSNWSLNGGGSNSPYSNSSGNAVVTFPDGPATANITVAAGGVIQPQSITFTNANTAYTFSGGPIAGTTNVVLNGSGNVTFSSSNSYNGGTTVNAGTLTAGADLALGGGPLAVGANGTANFLTANPTVGSLSGSGAVLLGGASGPATVNFTVNQAISNTFSGVISQNANTTASLVKSGAGTLYLTGANTYGGATTISAGELMCAGASSLGSGGITLSGGTLGMNASVAGLQQGLLGGSSGGNYANWTGTPLSWSATNGFTIANTGVNVQTNGNYAPWWTQSTWVVQGEFYWPGNSNGNKVTFYWNIDDLAELKIDGSLWQGQAPCWPSPDLTGVLAPGWHTIQWRGSNDGGPGGDANNYPSTPTASEIGFGWDPNGGTNLSLMPSSGQTYTIGSTNYTMQYEVPGSVTLANALTVTANSGIDLSQAIGGQLNFPSLSIGDNIIHIGGGGTSGGGTANIIGQTSLTGNTAATFDVQTGNVLDLQGQVVASGASGLTKTGSGTLLLSNNTNAYTGTTTIGGGTLNGGTLVAVGQSYASPGPATGALGSGPIVLGNGTLALTSSAAATTFDLISGNPLTITGSNSTIIAGSTLAGAASGTLTLTGSGSLPIAAGQTLNLGSISGWSLVTGSSFGLSNSGTLSGGPGSASVNLAVSAGTVTAASGGTLTVLNGVNSGYFAPASTGTVVLSGAYSGSLSSLAPASGGTLVINSNTTSGALSVAGGSYIVPSASAFGPVSLQFNGGSIGAATALTGSNAIANPWAITAGSAAGFNGASALELSSSTVLPTGNESIHILNPNLTVTLSGLISGPGALVRASDTTGQVNGTLVINNPGNTFSGGFTLQSSGGNVDVQGASTVITGGSIASGPLGIGTITIGSSNGLFINLFNSSSTAVTLANPMKIYEGAGYSSVSGLTFTGPVTLTGPGQGTTNNGVIDFWMGTNDNLAFSGQISSGSSQGINLRQGYGSGGLTLSNSTNNYTGPTSITMGTLIAGGNVTSGSPGVFGRAASAITIGDANSGTNAAALITNGAYSIGRPVTINATAGPTTLGTTAPGATLFSAAVTQNTAKGLTISSPPGGEVMFSGGISGSGGVGLAASSTVVFGSTPSTYTGTTTVNSGASLTLDFTSISGGSNAISPSSGLVLNGGTMNILAQGGGAATNQTFASLTISDPGGVSPAISVNANGGSGVAVNFGSLSRVGQATIDLSVATYAVTGTLVNGIAGGYATVNGTDWLANGTPPGYSGDDFSVATNNVDVQLGGAANYTGPTTVNSLRFNTAAATPLSLPDLLTLNTGGILVTPNVGSGTLSISGGSLTASGGTAANPGSDVVVNQFNTTTPFTISSSIVNSGSLSIGLTKAGPGTLILAGSNTYSGPTTINAGSLVGSAVNFPTNITVNSGGNVTFLENGASPLSTGITVSGAGTLTKDGSQTLTLTGSISTASLSVVNGTLNLGFPGNVVSGPVNVATGATLGMTGGSSGGGLLAQFYQDNNAVTGAPAGGNYAGGYAFTLSAYNAILNALTPNTVASTSGNGNLTLNFPDGTYGNGPFGKIIPSTASYTQYYDVRMSGYFTVPTTGTYYLRTGSDDGSMVWLNGTEVVNNNYYQGVAWRGSSALSLTAGALYPITIGYYQGTGGESLDVQYSTDDTNWTDVPNSMLSSPGCTIGPLSGAGTVNVPGVLFESSTNSSEFDGLMTGNGAFYKTGTGTLTLTNSNSTFNGTVRINAGTLQLTNPLVLQNATLDLEAADTGTLDTSTASLTSLVLGGLMGTQNLAAPAGPLTVGGNNTSTTYSGNLTGATSLTKAGSGTWVLTSTASSFGPTTINNGAIQIAAGTVLANNTVAVNSTAGLIFGSGVSAATIGGLSGSGSVVLQTIDSSPLPVTLAAGGNGQNTTFSGALNGSGGLTKTGPGTLTLIGSASNFTGALTVNSGVLEVTNLSNLNSTGAGPINVGGSAPATLRFIGSNDFVDRAVNLGNNATLDASETSQDVNNNLFFNQPVTGSGFNLTLTGTSIAGGELGATVTLGSGALIKNGSGTWGLDVANSYSGGTIINAGYVFTGDPGSLGSGPVTVNGGTLDVSYPGLNAAALSVGNAGALTIQIGNLVAISGAANFAGTLNVLGTTSGSVDLMNYQSHTGQFAAANVPSGYSLDYTPTELELVQGVVVTGGTWNLSGPSKSWSNAANWSSATVPTSGTVTFAGAPAAALTVTLDGPETAGALVFNSTNGKSYTLAQGSGGTLSLLPGASVAVQSGSDTISAPLALEGNLSVNPAPGTQLAITGNIGESVAGQALTLTGSGELILAGANTYTDGTTIDYGTLVVTSSAALPAGHSLVVGAGGTFVFDPSVTAAPLGLVASLESAAPLSVSSAGGLAAVPEPAGLALLATALASAAVAWRFRRRK